VIGEKIGGRAVGASTVLCVCGLASEARIARRAGFSVVVGAGDRQRTAALVASAVAETSCLVSFGIAGALAPQLRPGDVVLSGEVVAPDGRWQSEETLCRRLGALAREIGAIQGPVYGAPAPLALPRQKEHARNETGALAVDLESDIVARAAQQVGIPFVVLRAIADTLDRELPSAALIPLAADGTPALLRVLAEIVRRPRQLRALVGLARETRMALSALVRPARALYALLAAEPGHRLLDMA
jgi:adenosylhomocysteine nucleosidase